MCSLPEIATEKRQGWTLLEQNYFVPEGMKVLAGSLRLCIWLAGRLHPIRSISWRCRSSISYPTLRTRWLGVVRKVRIWFRKPQAGAPLHQLPD